MGFSGEHSAPTPFTGGQFPWTDPPPGIFGENNGALYAIKNQRNTCSAVQVILRWRWRRRVSARDFHYIEALFCEIVNYNPIPHPPSPPTPPPPPQTNQNNKLRPPLYSMVILPIYFRWQAASSFGRGMDNLFTLLYCSRFLVSS